MGSYFYKVKIYFQIFFLRRKSERMGKPIRRIEEPESGTFSTFGGLSLPPLPKLDLGQSCLQAEVRRRMKEIIMNLSMVKGLIWIFDLSSKLWHNTDYYRKKEVENACASHYLLPYLNIS